MPLPLLSQVVLTSSNLPVVCIYTYGQPISPDSAIMCDMGIIYNGPGMINHISDPFNNYEGAIRIKKRGNTSLFFPKNSYSVETVDAGGNNLNVSLVDLPEENDWVLYGPFPDKTLIRNVITYELVRRMGWYAPRTRFCEVVLDNAYAGVYVLIEKIKRDNNRVDISKLNPGDTTGMAVTGGYIIQVDHWQGAGWNSQFNELVYFEYVYPDDEDIMPQQQAYIQNFVYQLEDSLFNLSNDEAAGLPESVDVNSFMDYIILNELSKNADAYRLSTYFYKDHDAEDGRLKMGPVWDYDLTFGNYCDYEAYLVENFIYSDTIFWNNSLFWFRKLMEQDVFRNELKCRWQSLRSDILSVGAITAIIDSCYTFLLEAQERNFERWPILGVQIWPNYYVGATYEEEIEILKDWINGRLAWLDANFPGDCPFSGTTNPAEDNDGMNFSTFPNPATNQVAITFSAPEAGHALLMIHDMAGKCQLQHEVFIPKGSGSKIKLALKTLSPGIYSCCLLFNHRIAGVQKLVKLSGH